MASATIANANHTQVGPGPIETREDAPPLRTSGDHMATGPLDLTGLFAKIDQSVAIAE